MSNVQTWRYDNDRDGKWDRTDTRTNYTDAAGNLDYVVEQTDFNADGVDITVNTDNVYDAAGKLDFKTADIYDVNGVNSRTVTDYNYDGQGRYVGESSNTDIHMDGVRDQHVWVYKGLDEAGRVISSTTDRDNNGDGVVDESFAETYSYDAAGKIVNERTYTTDWNSDGTPDYSDVTNYQYNINGQITSKESYTLFNGHRSPSTDYRLETYTYNSNNLLEELRIDDWSEYDFVIAWKYKYNSAGMLTSVKEMDPFDYGDEKFHNTEAYKYDKHDNTKLIESNIYNTVMNGQHILEDKGKLYYGSDGLLKKEVHVGSDFKWKPVTGYQEEYWHNSLGQKDTQLTSFDMDGDGKYEASTRTLQRWSFNEDGSVASHSVDYNTGDGHAEFLYTSDALLA